MIATHRFVEIGGAGIVEHVFGEVQHAVVEGFVLQDAFVGLGCDKGFVKLTFRDEIVLVQVTFVDREHVDQHECRQSDGGNIGFELVFRVKENDLREGARPGRAGAMLPA